MNQCSICNQKLSRLYYKEHRDLYPNYCKTCYFFKRRCNLLDQIGVKEIYSLPILRGKKMQRNMQRFRENPKNRELFHPLIYQLQSLLKCNNRLHKSITHRIYQHRKQWFLECLYITSQYLKRYESDPSKFCNDDLCFRTNLSYALSSYIVIAKHRYPSPPVLTIEQSMLFTAFFIKHLRELEKKSVHFRRYWKIFLM